MKKLIVPEEHIKEEDDNIVPFTKPKYDDSDTDWLWQLPIGTVFLVKPPRDKDGYGREIISPHLLEFHLTQKEDNPRSVQLLTNLNTDQYMWEDSRIFSTIFRLHKIRYQPKDE